jgi:hypothetical protein
VRYVIAGIITAAMLAAGAQAQAQAPSGTVVVATKDGAALAAGHVRASGTISAVDKETRTVTITGDAGRVIDIEASPEVKNFDKLATGQRVDFEYVEAVTLELKKGEGVVVGRTDQAEAKSAAPGSMPAAVRGRETRITAEVVALDAEKRSVKLKGPNREVELEIPDAEQFARIAVGDHIEATYTEAFAIAVTPASAP